MQVGSRVRIKDKRLRKIYGKNLGTIMSLFDIGGFDFIVALDGRDGWVAFRESELELWYKQSWLDKLKMWWMMNTVLRPYRKAMDEATDKLIKEAEEKGLV